jgi:hypothetical protein
MDLLGIARIFFSVVLGETVTRGEEECNWSNRMVANGKY